MEHKVFKILTDDFGGSKKPKEYSIQSICAAVINEKNKSAKAKLKTLFDDVFHFSSSQGKYVKFVIVIMYHEQFVLNQNATNDR